MVKAAILYEIHKPLEVADVTVARPKAGIYLAGRLKLDELISREYPIEQVNEAFRALEAGEVARSIVTL